MSAKEYYLLDYLQSTGNQHINTGLTTKAKYWVDGDFSFDKNVSTYMFIFGVWASLSLGTNGSNLVFGHGSAESNPSSHTIEFNKKYNFKFGQRRVLGDGVSLWSTTSYDNSTSGGTLYLFSNNYKWCDYYSYGKIYQLKLYEGTFNSVSNSTLIRNYLSVRRISDSVLGMYDTVTDTFLPNSGSGTFNAGSNKLGTIDVFSEDTSKGTVSVLTNRYLYPDNTMTVTLQASVKNEYEFAGWYTEDGVMVSNNSVDTIIVKNGTKLIAKFIAPTGIYIKINGKWNKNIIPRIKTINNNSMLGDGNINVHPAIVYANGEVQTQDVWVDGKPIYRKCYTGILDTNGSDHSLIDNSINSTNSNLIKIEGFLVKSDGGGMDIGSYVNSTWNSGVHINTDSLYVFRNSQFAGAQFNLIIYYTKK